MAHRGPAERAAKPSVVAYDAPDVCPECKPLLAREEKFHAKAFEKLAQSLDDVLGRLNEAYREVREVRARLRDAGHDCKALLAEYVALYNSEQPLLLDYMNEGERERLLDYFRRAYELGQRSQKSVTPPVTP